MLQVFGKTMLCKTLDVASQVAHAADLDGVTPDGKQVSKKGSFKGGYIDRSRLACTLATAAAIRLLVSISSSGAAPYVAVYDFSELAETPQRQLLEFPVPTNWFGTDSLYVLDANNFSVLPLVLAKLFWAVRKHLGSLMDAVGAREVLPAVAQHASAYGAAKGCVHCEQGTCRPFASLQCHLEDACARRSEVC